MIIANPLLDVVFKYLMQDLRVAKFLIETLTGEQIVHIEVKAQDKTYESQLLGLKVLRLDFKAKIKTENEGHKNVLIEVQKTSNPADLMRFRNYLAENYKTEDEIINEKGEKIIMPISIISIFILGFELPDLEYNAIKIKRNYIDMHTGEVINKKNDFIENLSHDCFVVQAIRLQPKVQTRLDKLLSIFEQRYYIDTKGHLKEYPYPVDDEEMNHTIQVLQKAGGDAELKQKIEGDEFVIKEFDFAVKNMEIKVINKLAKELKNNDVPVDIISISTGLTIEEIKNLK